MFLNNYFIQSVALNYLQKSSIKEENYMKRPSIFKNQNILQELPIGSNPSFQALNIISDKNCISNASTRKCSVDSNDTRITTKASRFKTQTCKFWLSGKQCPYAKNCRFAHGYQEQRELPIVQQNYKTKNCKNFFQQGCCLYGVRCLFLHQKLFPQRQKQFYRKRMSQIHKDSQMFFMNQKRLMILRDLEYQIEDDKQNSNTNSIRHTSGSKIDSNSSINSQSSLKKVQSVLFSMQNYAKTAKKQRHYSIRL